MTSLDEIILSSANRAIEKQRENGSMPPGKNGPWNDSETPVRNTSHWLITFSYSYEKTGEERYLAAANEAANYLLSDEARPYGKTFHYRYSDAKDRCNGLIGQAWSIIALCYGSKTLGRSELAETAHEVLKYHPFIDNLGCWMKVEIDGQGRQLDFTVNRQIWFAAAGAFLTQFEFSDDSIAYNIDKFLNSFPGLISRYENGPVYHVLDPDFMSMGKVYWLRENLRARRIPKPLLHLRNRSLSAELRQKSVGYYSFILYGLAMLYEVFPTHSIWERRDIQEYIDYGFSEEFRQELDGNKFGYPYNCSGIEMAYVGEVFGKCDTIVNEFLERQITSHYCLENNMMDKNVTDPNTVAARIYEATRLDTSRDIDL